jgi:hypothetical protein
VFSRLQHHLCCTKYCLGWKLCCHISWYSHLDSSIWQSFYYNVYLLIIMSNKKYVLLFCMGVKLGLSWACLTKDSNKKLGKLHNDKACIFQGIVERLHWGWNG